jgi:hypothetical protein
LPHRRPHRLPVVECAFERETVEYLDDRLRFDPLAPTEARFDPRE